MVLRQVTKWSVLLYWIGLLGGWSIWDFGGSYLMIPIFLATPAWGIGQLMLGGALLLRHRKDGVGWIAVGSGVVLAAASLDAVVIFNNRQMLL